MIKNNSHQEGAIQNHEVKIPYFVERRGYNNNEEKCKNSNH